MVLDMYTQVPLRTTVCIVRCWFILVWALYAALLRNAPAFLVSPAAMGTAVAGAALAWRGRCVRTTCPSPPRTGRSPQLASASMPRYAYVPSALCSPDIKILNTHEACTPRAGQIVQINLDHIPLIWPAYIMTLKCLVCPSLEAPRYLHDHTRFVCVGCVYLWECMWEPACLCTLPGTKSIDLLPCMADFFLQLLLGHVVDSCPIVCCTVHWIEFECPNSNCTLYEQYSAAV